LTDPPGEALLLPVFFVNLPANLTCPLDARHHLEPLVSGEGHFRRQSTRIHSDAGGIHFAYNPHCLMDIGNNDQLLAYLKQKVFGTGAI
jgi:hypothetical protein